MNSDRRAHEVPGLPQVLVDGFRQARAGVSEFFLTHAHGDHYGGLNDQFELENCYLYATSRTASFAANILGVSRDRMIILQDETGVLLQNSVPAIVTACGANHCPGAAMLLFEVFSTRLQAEAVFAWQSTGGDQLLQGHVIADGAPSSTGARKGATAPPRGVFTLHTGDFRACIAMQRYPCLLRCGQGQGHHSAAHEADATQGSAPIAVRHLFVDTTYCRAKHTFLP